VSKKRRIYDITNVLEGVNLIQKVEKNFYVWRGKNNDDEIDNRRLEEKQLESKELLEEEQRLTEYVFCHFYFFKDPVNDKMNLRPFSNFRDINGMRVNLAALLHSKSFAYITRNDFKTAYGRTNSVFVAKNVKKIFVDRDEELEHPFIFLLSEVHNPVHLQLVNTEPKKSNKSANSLLCHEKLTSEKIHKFPRPEDFKRLKHIDRITLFRRRVRCKKFLEIDEKEREEIANVVLNRTNSENSKKRTCVDNDEEIIDPDFIQINHPVDYDYYDNYSSEPASIHDLFDFDVEPMVFLEEEFIHDYIEEEHVEDDN
jgi:hypothetical protein